VVAGGAWRGGERAHLKSVAPGRPTIEPIVVCTKSSSGRASKTLSTGTLHSAPPTTMANGSRTPSASAGGRAASCSDVRARKRPLPSRSRSIALSVGADAWPSMPPSRLAEPWMYL